MPRLDIDVRGLDAAQTTIADLRERARRTAPFFLAVAEDITERVRLGFTDGRDPWGGAWAPLSPVTLARRRGGGVGAQPLLDRGLLRNSISSRTDETSAAVGTTDVRAPTHQFGARRGAYRQRPTVPWGDIPARPFFPIRPDGTVDLPPEWAADIRERALEHFRVAA